MYNGIGLSTPRGSGTSGHVNKNYGHVKERKLKQEWSKESEKKPTFKRGEKANEKLLEHERKREIEVEVMEWAERKGLSEEKLGEEIYLRTLQEKREQLHKKHINSQNNKKNTNTHLLLVRKEEDNKTMSKALRISQDYKEGSALNKELQHKKKEERQANSRKQKERKIEEKGEEGKNWEEREAKKRRKNESSSSSPDSSFDD